MEAGAKFLGDCRSSDWAAASECRTESQRPVGVGADASGCPLQGPAGRRKRFPDPKEEEGGPSWSSGPCPLVAVVAGAAVAAEAAVDPLVPSSGERKFAPYVASAASVDAAESKQACRLQKIFYRINLENNKASLIGKIPGPLAEAVTVEAELVAAASSPQLSSRECPSAASVGRPDRDLPRG